MKLGFSGSPEVEAPRRIVWQRLIDPHFVAGSAPGVESVTVIDATHFRVISGFGPQGMKARITLDGELFDLVPGIRAKMRLRGKGPGSVIEVLSTIAVHDAAPGKVRLHWTATSEVSGTVANLGAKLLEGVARRMTEQFWNDFARRGGSGGDQDSRLVVYHEQLQPWPRSGARVDAAQVDSSQRRRKGIGAEHVRRMSSREGQHPHSRRASRLNSRRRIFNHDTLRWEDLQPCGGGKVNVRIRLSSQHILGADQNRGLGQTGPVQARGGRCAGTRCGDRPAAGGQQPQQVCRTFNRG